MIYYVDCKARTEGDGSKERPFKNINDAAKIACADEFISSFPEGYDTLLGQGGANLSGGDII